MKTILNRTYLFTSFLILYGCFNDKLNSKLENIITPILLQEKTVSKIDDFNIYRIDTLTELKDSVSKLEILKFKLKVLNLDLESYKLNRKTELSLAEADKASDKEFELLTGKKTEPLSLHANRAKDLLEDISKTEKNIRKVTDRISNIEVSAKNNKLNNKDFKGYIVYGKLIGADSLNKLVKIDTLKYMISPSFHIIPYNDINRK